MNVAVNKQHILDEIKRTAKANGDVPLGRVRFESETGIKEFDWRGRYWVRWGDAVREAGFVPNGRPPKTQEDVLFAQLGAFIRELGRYPTVSEMRLRKREDDAFPNHDVLERGGLRQQLIKRLLAFCERTDGWSDVAALCRIMATVPPGLRESESRDDFKAGYVYLALMKVGREKRYKIGKADIVGRRARQIAVHLPEDLELVHAISTDDAYGIEAYWHKRFAEKPRRGEWFELTAADVKTFRRRKFM
jgi:hypothetical protein